MTTQPLVKKHERNTIHQNNNNFFQHLTAPVANGQCFRETQENKLCRQIWTSVLNQNSLCSFHLFL